MKAVAEWAQEIDRKLSLTDTRGDALRVLRNAVQDVRNELRSATIAVVDEQTASVAVDQKIGGMVMAAERRWTREQEESRVRTPPA